MEKVDNNKPYPLKLGELKPLLQKEANENDRSLAGMIRKILKDYLVSKKKNNDEK